MTLDTTRVDVIGPEAKGIETPAFNALAARGLRFRQAYAAVPQTLPSHTTMLTGLYPGGHGLRENGRFLSSPQPLVSEKLKSAGYSTAAFVSAFAVARRFGLARGFDVYDDEAPQGLAERTAAETTDHALAWLAKNPSGPRFVWVHYYDPHYPYTPPEPFASKYRANPYLGEVASMDAQLGRLVAAFEKSGDPLAIVVVGDHGEGLGEHGEAQHGNLLYQSTMHVPLLVLGPGLKAGTNDTPVSTRHVFDTILDFAGLDAPKSLREPQPEVVMGEAMKPFLDYGWQPQVMAVDGRRKTIMAGRLEAYDVIADPAEARDLGANADLSREARAALRDYPLPSQAAPEPEAPVDEDARKKLASLGYVSSSVKPVIRADAPRPADMAPLFDTLDLAAGLFVRERYAEAVPLLKKILESDPYNLDSALRLATALSSLGRNAEAEEAFAQAQKIAPQSQDVQTYFALHLARTENWQKAVPLLEKVVAEAPNRLPAVEALATVRERQQRLPEAIALRQRAYSMRTPSAAELAHLGEMQMAVGDTNGAIASFEGARSGHELELGVLYLASGRYADARGALDQVPANSPAYPMALFKRAQVAVLLHEPDAAARIAAAREHANAATRPLIEQERLFR